MLLWLSNKKAPTHFPDDANPRNFLCCSRHAKSLLLSCRTHFRHPPNIPPSVFLSDFSSCSTSTAVLLLSFSSFLLHWTPKRLPEQASCKLGHFLLFLGSILLLLYSPCHVTNIGAFALHSPEISRALIINFSMSRLNFRYCVVLHPWTT